MLSGPSSRLSLLLLVTACAGRREQRTSPIDPDLEVRAPTGTPVASANSKPGAARAQASGWAPLPEAQSILKSVPVASASAVINAPVFAAYLQIVHENIHPHFADEFLESLASQPADHPLQGKLTTVVEIQLEKDRGKIVKMGVIRASGETLFDAGVLASIEDSARRGFGRPPEATVSPDGKVYIQWEFQRDPKVACSPRNARLFVLAARASL